MGKEFLVKISTTYVYSRSKELRQMHQFIEEEKEIKPILPSNGDLVVRQKRFRRKTS